MRFKEYVLLGGVLVLLGGQSVEAQRSLAIEQTKSRVLDKAFQLDTIHDSYVAKVVLRYGDTDTQIVLTIYPAYPFRPDGNVLIAQYSLEGLHSEGLTQHIAKILAANPNATAADIAATLIVKKVQAPIEYDMVHRWLMELKAIRLSPAIESRAVLDAYSEYEFWFYTGQECTHYSLKGPFETDPQDRLVQWMLRFRAAIAKSSQTQAHVQKSAETTPTMR
ncbi:MAG: hypothetical protein AB1700_16025 [Bacillota bacterium]